MNDDDYGKIPPVKNSHIKPPGGWIKSNPDDINDLKDLMRDMNSGWGTIDDKPLKLSDEARANRFVAEVEQALTNYYAEKLKQLVDNKQFTGLYLNFKEMIEHFSLTWQTPTPEDSSCEVTFSLKPHPFQQQDSFEAYGIVLYPDLIENDFIKDTFFRPYLYGVDMFGINNARDDYSPEPSIQYTQHKGLVIDFGKGYASNSLSNILWGVDELYWHRVVLQSILNYYNDNPNELPMPMQVFLDIARYNRIPDKETFLKEIDKAELTEALE